MTYPTLNVTDTQDLYTLFNWINNISDGYFFPVILGCMWMIIFLGGVIRAGSPGKSWTFASFVGAIIGILLGLMGWLNPIYIYFLVILTAFGLLWIRLENAPN